LAGALPGPAGASDFSPHAGSVSKMTWVSSANARLGSDGLRLTPGFAGSNAAR